MREISVTWKLYARNSPLKECNMNRKKRRWEDMAEDDPTAGLLNLFDVWIAFAAALLLAMAGYLNLPHSSARQAAQTPRTRPETAEIERLKAEAVKMQRYRPTQEPLSGEGQRLGVAYRLKSGEVVYVPEGSQLNP